MAGGSVGELANMPMTAHIIGGAPIGVTADDGVVDPWQRLHGYAGLHVIDGAAVTANLGVNPSLTITAQAERAMAFWPNKGEPDPRPVPGADYVVVAPVTPGIRPCRRMPPGRSDWASRRRLGADHPDVRGVRGSRQVGQCAVPRHGCRSRRGATKGPA